VASFPNDDTKFKKGITGNPNGRPRKKYSEHINDIKAKGYVAPVKHEYFEMVGLLLSMTEDDLKEFAQDKDRPYWIRLIILDLNNKNIRSRLMSDYRDWLYGKADQKTEVSGTVTYDRDLAKELINMWYNPETKKFEKLDGI